MMEVNDGKSGKASAPASPVEKRVKSDKPQNENKRVILLLDLDCFYAQCETVRLGLPQSIPLALLQWNSALAVNYPARSMGIKRGDSFSNITKKSDGKCIAIHLPIIPIETTRPKPAMEVLSNSQPTTPNGTIPSLKRPCPPSSSSSNMANMDDQDNENTTTEARTVTQDLTQVISTPQESLTSNEEPKFVDENETHHAVEEEEEDEEVALEKTYRSTFCLSLEDRQEAFARDKNRMRRPSEGKASLERYRLASSMIFSVVMKALSNHVGKGNFVLERASIDELFLDVTEHCYSEVSEVWSSSERTQDKNSMIGSFKKENAEEMCESICLPHLTKKETVVVGCNAFSSSSSSVQNIDDQDQDDDKEDVRALWRGCVVARGIRQAVCQRLGFTLSAGVSTSKAVAKLGASYGKPNGQAVILPRYIAKVMEETPIRKVRNLGGKIGKKVLTLLPEGEETMGSIARLLSLPTLSETLGAETGRWVWDAARGIDSEAVKETVGALTKSITAFKSFPACNLDGIRRWIPILAQDVVHRVAQDTRRNHRYPKICAIHYVYGGEGGFEFVARSIRIPFPKESGGAPFVHLKGVQSKSPCCSKLEEATLEALKTKGHFPIRRLGLCASEFETRAKVGIKTFFERAATWHSVDGGDVSQMNTENAKQEKDKMQKTPFGRSVTGNDDSKRTGRTHINEMSEKSPTSHGSIEGALQSISASSHDDSVAPKGNIELDEDLAFAQKLQASFDREHQVLSLVERQTSRKETTNIRKRQKTISSSSSSPFVGKAKKTGSTLENFFIKR